MLITLRKHLLSSSFSINKMLILPLYKFNIDLSKKILIKKLTLLTEHYYHHI